MLVLWASLTPLHTRDPKGGGQSRRPALAAPFSQFWKACTPSTVPNTWLLEKDTPKDRSRKLEGPTQVSAQSGKALFRLGPLPHVVLLGSLHPPQWLSPQPAGQGRPSLRPSLW